MDSIVILFCNVFSFKIKCFPLSWELYDPASFRILTPLESWVLLNPVSSKMRLIIQKYN